ncbi:DUF3375 family protein [Streptomyces sp. SID4951]|nr:DUF3375 family protein [Streptomyces sp. SID4951]
MAVGVMEEIHSRSVGRPTDSPSPRSRHRPPQPDRLPRPCAELAERLDDELFALNERRGQRTFPASAKAHLDDWPLPEIGWLRKYYPPDSDEPHYDAKAARSSPPGTAP